MPPKAASPPAACPSHRSSRCWVARLAGTAASSTIPPPRCRSIISALGQKLRQPARDPPSPWARRGLSTTRRPCTCLPAVRAHLQRDRTAGASPRPGPSGPATHPHRVRPALESRQGECRLGAEQPSCARARACGDGGRALPVLL